MGALGQERCRTALSLIPYERDLLEFMDRELGVERSLLIGFAATLDCLRRLFQDVIIDTPHHLKAGRLVVIGLINYTHHLLVGGLQALRDGNGPVWSLCARALMETFGASVLITEHPQTAPNYLELGSKAGKLRAAAERAQPGLGNDISRLSDIAHPGSRAILSGFRVVDVEERIFNMLYGLRRPGPDEAKEAVTVLANLATLIGDKLEALSGNLIVMQSGKVIGQKPAGQ